MNLLQTLTIVINTLTLFAARTATKVDDAALAFLQAVKDSPALLKWLEGVIPHDADFTTLDVNALSVEQASEGQQLIAAAGLDWTKFIDMLPVIIGLIRQFRQAA